MLCLRLSLRPRENLPILTAITKTLSKPATESAGTVIALCLCGCWGVLSFEFWVLSWKTRRVDLVHLVCLVYQVISLVSFIQTHETDRIDQTDEIDQRDQKDEMATRRVEVGIMPQDMATSPYNKKYLLLKMPYRFNTSYQLLARHCLRTLSHWFLSLDFRRSRP